MDRISIWLADENEHYVELMKRYIRTSDFRNKLNIAVYTDLQCFEQALEHIPEESIVLVSALFIPLCKELTHSTVILLNEEKSLGAGADKLYHHVYKYRPLNQLLDQTLNIYYESKVDVNQLVSESSKHTKVVAIYSASGGSGVTTVAQQLSDFSASLGKKVFHLNLETIHSMISSTNDNVITRFTQVLYMIKSGQPLLGKLHQVLCTDHSGNYDMFHPTRYSREWLEYERGDIQLLILALINTNKYDMIIMDVGSSLWSPTVGALEFCDQLLWVIPDRLGALAKFEYVRSELRKLSLQLYDRIHKHCKYVLQQFSEDQVTISTPDMMISAKLPYIPDWQRQAVGAPPLEYRKVLLQLIGLSMEEGTISNGTAAGETIHRPA